MSSEELTTREQGYNTAQAQRDQMVARLELLEAGAWKPDLAVAETAVLQAEAQIKRVETDLARLRVCALIDGTVLQVNVRPGEYVGLEHGTSLVVLGNVEVLHVRADIDEEDIGRFQQSASAVAEPRGGGSRYPLQLKRIEPLVVQKRSLTGDGRERVDVRVLQAIFALTEPTDTLYVGQQVDVFINAGEVTATDAIDDLAQYANRP